MSIRYMVLEVDMRDPQQPRSIIWEFDHHNIKDAEKARTSIMKRYNMSAENISVIMYRE